MAQARSSRAGVAAAWGTALRRLQRAATVMGTPVWRNVWSGHRRRNVVAFCLLLVAASGVELGLAGGDAGDFKAVTCGSVVKLTHGTRSGGRGETGAHLHSHSLAWGTGSRQQSVTAVHDDDDPNSMWLVKEAHGATACQRGAVVPCGSTIRLEHAHTGRNLHSHLVAAPVTGNQEVSGFGEAGVGDHGDNWSVTCMASGAANWMRGDPVRLKHVDTGAVLTTSQSAEFNQVSAAIFIGG